MIVLTLGTFDLFHEGHLELLMACSGLSGAKGKVVVAAAVIVSVVWS
jgi:cytidyltransferase-like protein